MERCDIAIIGAGIGGLTFALAALRRGLSVRIFEQAPKIEAVGAGISIAPNSLKVLHKLGLEQDLAELGCYPRAGIIRDGATGEALSETAFDDYRDHFGAPYLQIHRADLHEVILRAASGLTTRLLATDHQLSALAQDAEGVELGFANGARMRAEVVVGADGLKSRTRAALFGERPARYTGVVAWRGTVPTHQLPKESRLMDSNVWALPNRSIVQHPVCAGREMHFSGLASDQPWTEESWTVRSSVDELVGVFEGFAAPIMNVLTGLRPDAVYKWALHDRDPLPTWVKGRVALLGDAAHPMLPFLAQGASMAIEDAWVLATALGGDMANIEDKLQSYVAVRHPRATFVQLGARAAREKLAGFSPETERDEPILRPDTLFGWDPDQADLELHQFDVTRFEG